MSPSPSPTSNRAASPTTTPRSSPPAGPPSPRCVRYARPTTTTFTRSPTASSRAPPVESHTHELCQSPCLESDESPAASEVGGIDEIERAGEFGVRPHKWQVAETLAGLRVDLLGEEWRQRGTQGVGAFSCIIRASDGGERRHCPPAARN